MRQNLTRTALAAVAVQLSSAAARAVVNGQSDNFQDGTLDNWAGGDTLTNVSTGGPAGAGDKYLHITSTGGGGQGSHLATLNSVQWAGNYLAAGVTDISVDLLNPDTVDLPMRILLFGPTGGRWESVVADTVPADNLWHHELFSLAQSDLVNVSGSDTYAATIAGATQLMIRYDPTASAGGTAFSGSLGIDNVTAGLDQWKPNASGDWNTASNWTTSHIPNGVGVEADFFAAIQSAQTISTGTPITVGTLNFNNASTYQIAGTGSLTLQATSANAQVIVQSGTQEINLPTTIASDTVLNIAAASTLIVASPLTINPGLTLTQTGAGTLLVGASGVLPASSNVSITGGTLKLGTGTGLAQMSSLSITGGGVLDVNNNHLIINYGSGPDPIASIAAWIASGAYGSGTTVTWSGTGITSSAAASNPSYGIGYADSADPGNPAGLATGQLEFAYTLLGDANLDYKVNGTDFNLMATNFNLAVTNGWDKGDFNYDGKVNGTDFVLLANNFNQFASQSAVSGEVSAADLEALDSFAAANGISLPNVPEPATTGLMVMAGLGILRRCRRVVSKASI